MSFDRAAAGKNLLRMRTIMSTPLILPHHPAGRARGLGVQFRGEIVGGDVVEDGVDRLAGRDGDLDGVEETDELPVAMTLHATAEHGAIQDV